MIVYSAWKRYNVRENTNMHILFGNYSEKIVYVCCRSLRGSVDWNSRSSTALYEIGQSLPPRERGLKSFDWLLWYAQDSRSLRGSVDWNSYSASIISSVRLSLPPRERGLKLRSAHPSAHPDTSLPPRERGLKSYSRSIYLIASSVAPSAGAWIEISESVQSDTSYT